MIPIYEVLYIDGLTPGVYGVSLVDIPATEVKMLQFSEDKSIQIKLQSQEERIVVAPIIIPNQKIYRNDEMGEYYIYFTEDVIKQTQQNFFKQGYQNNSTINHIQPIIESTTIFESWLIEDPKNDKSNALGFNLPKGTWMVSMKIQDETIWENYIKTGKLNGLSIDSIFNLKRINQKQNKMKYDQNLIKDLLTQALEYLDNGDMSTSGSTSGSTSDISVETETEIEMAVVPEPIQPMDVIKPEPTVQPDEKDKLIQQLESKVAELEAKVVEYENKLAESENKIVKMSLQPVSEGIKDVDLTINKPVEEPTSKFGRIAQTILNAKNKQ